MALVASISSCGPAESHWWTQSGSVGISAPLATGPTWNWVARWFEWGSGCGGRSEWAQVVIGRLVSGSIAKDAWAFARSIRDQR